MDSGTPNDQLGNTGEWFLKAVGEALESPPEPVVLEPHIEAASAPSDIDTATPTELDSTDAPAPAETTSEMVDQMWRSTGEPDPLEDWEPADLDRQVSRTRNFRVTVWIMAALVLAAVVAAALLSPRLVERQAASEAREYSSALTDVRAVLPGTQQVLATLTEPTSDPTLLSDLVPDLSRVQAAADALIGAATSPLPQPLPLIPSDALDDLEPSRDAMARLGNDTAVLASRLSAGVSYRSLVVGFLDVGELPVQADAAAVRDLRARLATALADATSVLADLPDEAVFATHRAALSGAVEAFPDWETDYMDALTGDDPEMADSLISEHALLIAGLERDLIPALAEFRADLDAVILRLDQELVETINGLPR